MKITQLETGRLINNTVYVGQIPDTTYSLTLCTIKGEAMKYGKEATRIIDFPGEYDIGGLSITCKESGGMLHYVVRIDGQSHALVFNKAVLDSESFDEIYARWCADKDIKEKVEKMELDGEIHVLGEEEKPEESEQ